MKDFPEGQEFRNTKCSWLYHNIRQLGNVRSITVHHRPGRRVLEYRPLHHSGVSTVDSVTTVSVFGDASLLLAALITMDGLRRDW